MTPTICSAPSPSTTCSTTCCLQTGASDRAVRPVSPVARERRATPRLDQPQDTRRGFALPRYKPDSMGRISERVARFLGTWRFIGYMSLFIGGWVLYNVVVPHGWQFDRY